MCPAASSARRMRIHGPDLEKTTFVRFFVAARVLLAAARAAERKIQISQPAPSRTALRVARHPANPSRSRVASLHAPPTPPLDAGRGAQEVLRGASRKVFRPNPTGAPSAVSARFHLLPRRGPAARVDQPTHRPPSYAQARDAYFACLDANAARRTRRALRKAYEKACPPSWVKHFDKKREEDEKLRRLLETRDAATPAASSKAA